MSVADRFVVQIVYYSVLFVTNVLCKLLCASGFLSTAVESVTQVLLVSWCYFIVSVFQVFVLDGKQVCVLFQGAIYSELQGVAHLLLDKMGMGFAAIEVCVCFISFMSSSSLF